MKKLVLLALIGLAGCVNATSHVQDLHSSYERDLTVGLVQKEISPGMTQDEVAEALGSPNIVSQDREGNDVWVYDKIATEASYSNSYGSAGAGALAAGEPGATLLIGMLTGNYGRSAGASAVTEKTLTVVVKFDGRDRVQSARYHSSKF